MTDILIRGLSPRAVARIDAAARERGLSRNEYLRLELEAGDTVLDDTVSGDTVSGDTVSGDTVSGDRPWLTMEMLERSAERVKDLRDPESVERMWR
ncbi:MAG: hypothetical protein QM635_00725 [Microbacteriaceae bacterium]